MAISPRIARAYKARKDVAPMPTAMKPKIRFIAMPAAMTGIPMRTLEMVADKLIRKPLCGSADSAFAEDAS